MTRWPPKDPSDIADYSLEHVLFPSDDAVTSSSWTIAPSDDAGDLVQVASSRAGNLCSIRLSGGQAAVDYTVTNTITTSGGNTFQRSVKLLVNEL